MAYQLSPGVLVQERDLSNIVPAVSSSKGGYSGPLTWGPVMSPVIISSENHLVQVFGKPDMTTAASFYTAANYLAYSNFMYVNRQVGDNARNAVATGDAIIIKNNSHFEASYAEIPPTPSVGQFVAKYPGTLGNSIEVHMADASTFASWTYNNLFSYAPDSTSDISDAGGSYDELHVVIVDKGGVITGTPGTVLDRYEGLSKARGSVRYDGSDNYYKTVINNRCPWIWVVEPPRDGTNDILATWGDTDKTIVFEDLVAVVAVQLTGGVSHNELSSALIREGWDVFKNDETYDINLVPVGPIPPVDGQYVVDNIAIARRDCIAFLSPELVDVQSVDPATDVKTWRQSLQVNTSYAVLDSGWKKQYDKYTREYVNVPLNGDIAGLCAYTDYLRDPWFSPAGFNRGFVRNVVKLLYNPSKAERDELYPLGVNPVVTLPGEGTILLGDRTAQRKPSSFDRINVRRLFIALAKATATAAKYQLFEFNDEFTRANFRSMVEPYLADIQGRRGITEYFVRCDSSNNTAEIIDRNEFVAEIFVKPTRSINFIKLILTATRTGVQFEEVI